MVTNNGECMQEIRRRLALGRTAVRNLERVWKDVSTGTKLKIMERMVFPIVSYGAESWVLRKKDRKTIDAFELWAYRRMLRITWIQRKTNNWILEKCGHPDSLLSKIQNRQLQYCGHILRADNSLEKAMAFGKILGKRSRGRQRMRWVEWVSGLRYYGHSILQQKALEEKVSCCHQGRLRPDG